LRDEDVVSVLDLNDLNANDWKELGMTKYAVRDVMAALARMTTGWHTHKMAHG